MRTFTNLQRGAGTIPAPFSSFFPHWREVLFAIGLLLFIAPGVSATTYYVDSQGGDDTYNGLAPASQARGIGPWKTLTKVNFTTFAPGDSILFKRGGVWLDGPLEPVNGGAPGGTITISETINGQPFSFDLVDPANNNCIYFGAYWNSGTISSIFPGPTRTSAAT